MLWTIALMFLVLWALGLVAGVTMNGLIHVLLALAAIVVVVRVTRGEHPI